MPGLFYRCWCKTALTDANWILLGGAVEALGPEMSLTNDPGDVPQRFYRIVVTVHDP